MNVPLRALLKRTSRSFYLTLRVLPGSVRHQISLAYLLARTTDTIADTELVPVAQRLAALDELRQLIRAGKSSPSAFAALIPTQSSNAERALLEQREQILTQLQSSTSLADQKIIGALLEIIISGQELDLRRFADGTGGRIVALQSETELDDYTYRVAGCVGEFWTKICRAHVFPKAPLDEARLLADGVRFGKGLQLVNILRDLPADLRQGRCYLPKTVLAGAGLCPEDLLDAGQETKLRPLYNRYLDLAAAHLAAGWAYTNAIPWRCIRVRLACAWPVLIGLKTLGRLRIENPLDPARPVKITRTEVRGVIWRSVLFYPFPSVWRGLATLSER
jgi:farnesyl-diphosphate farnesyltransferase